MPDSATKKASQFDLFRLFFTSKGRINRQQYVLGWSILIALYLSLGLFFQFISDIIPFKNIWGVSQIVFMALFIIPHFFIMIKRLHDCNISGLFTLFIFVPLIGQVIALPIFILMSIFIRGTAGTNKHNQESQLPKSQPQYCNSCGTPIKENPAFCASCGKNLIR